MNWFVHCVKHYASFGGRAGRKEFWHYFLMYMLIVMVLTVIDAIIGRLDTKAGVGLLSGIFALVTLLPGLGVGIRRLHDIGRTGWWLLISVVPFVGAIVLLVFAATKGDAAANHFGAVPPQDA